MVGAQHAHGDPVAACLACALCGNSVGPASPLSLSIFSFRRGLRRTLLAWGGGRDARGKRSDWWGANWCRLSTKKEKVESDGTLMSSLPLLLGRGYAVLAARPEWTSVSTASKCEELDQHR